MIARTFAVVAGVACAALVIVLAPAAPKRTSCSRTFRRRPTRAAARRPRAASTRPSAPGGVLRAPRLRGCRRHVRAPSCSMRRRSAARLRLRRRHVLERLSAADRRHHGDARRRVSRRLRVRAGRGAGRRPGGGSAVRLARAARGFSRGCSGRHRRSSCPPDVPGTCWVLPAACPDHGGPDRWISCDRERPSARRRARRFAPASRTGARRHVPEVRRFSSSEEAPRRRLP